MRFAAAAGVVGASASFPMPAIAKVIKTSEKTLAFHHLHTGEKVSCVYWADGKLVPENVAQIDHILRDWRTGEKIKMDRELFDLLHRLRTNVGSDKSFDIISGYRSPKTNTMLRKKGSGGVATKSLHMQGKAIDVNLSGCDLADLRKAALKLKAGGVGYYPKSGFVHVDTGRVRSW